MPVHQNGPNLTKIKIEKYFEDETVMYQMMLPIFSILQKVSVIAA